MEQTNTTKHNYGISLVENVYIKNILIKYLFLILTLFLETCIVWNMLIRA